MAAATAQPEHLLTTPRLAPLPAGRTSALDVLLRVFEALAPGGRVVIQDHLMGPDKTAPRAGALFAINMLVNTEAGSTYTFAELSGWLRETVSTNAAWLVSTLQAR